MIFLAEFRLLKAYNVCAYTHDEFREQVSYTTNDNGVKCSTTAHTSTEFPQDFRERLLSPLLYGSEAINVPRKYPERHCAPQVATQGGQASISEASDESYPPS